MSAAIALLAVTGLAPAFAHHGFTGRYNAAEPIWIEGVVENAQFGGPHIEVRVRVAQRQALSPARESLQGLEPALRPRTPPPPLAVRSEFSNTAVPLEFPPISNFASLRGAVRAGDRVAAVVYRNCARPHQLRVQWFRDGQGRALPGRRSVQTEVERC